MTVLTVLAKEATACAAAAADAVPLRPARPRDTVDARLFLAAAGGASLAESAAEWPSSQAGSPAEADDFNT